MTDQERICIAVREVGVIIAEYLEREHKSGKSNARRFKFKGVLLHWHKGAKQLN